MIRIIWIPFNESRPANTDILAANYLRYVTPTVPSVADPGCLSRIRRFYIPDLGSRIRIKEFKYFNPKKWCLSSR
jgi:hypothetical protein